MRQGCTGSIAPWVTSEAVQKKIKKNILRDEGLIYVEGLTVQFVFANTETRSL